MIIFFLFCIIINLFLNYLFEKIIWIFVNNFFFDRQSTEEEEEEEEEEEQSTEEEESSEEASEEASSEPPSDDETEEGDDNHKEHTILEKKKRSTRRRCVFSHNHWLTLCCVLCDWCREKVEAWGERRFRERFARRQCESGGIVWILMNVCE